MKNERDLCLAGYLSYLATHIYCNAKLWGHSLRLNEQACYQTHTRCCNRIHTLLTGRYPISRPCSPNRLHSSCMAIWEHRSENKWKLQKQNVDSIPEGNNVYISRVFLSSVDTGSSSNCASDYRTWTKLCLCNSGIQILFWAFKKGNDKPFNKIKGKARWRHISNSHNDTPSKRRLKHLGHEGELMLL